ncbi:MAG: hypothetical protein LBI43_04500 [Streptococcaceae bacterium]|jgi:type I restriction enzyme S subunit|nr:hypothetical protein [Streptococcaceae bacterium]
MLDNSRKQHEDLNHVTFTDSEWARFVAIFDKFDQITTSLTEGLPREIELRTKQCEYDPDRLMTLEK